MKWWLLMAVAACAVMLTAGLFAYLSMQDDSIDKPVDLTHRPEVSIVLTEKGYVPNNITISKGTRVTFSSVVDREYWPASNPHPDHHIYSGFDPRQPVAASSTWSFVFDTYGVWGFHDHLRSYLTGTIYVE
jgi:hypothetical protein